ncbi:hypothetical protein SAMN05660284_02798 [Formivibrio citricus]|uniref:ATPase AAA-type core domain-containing protein n=1 Tax=Formivibrio citricus TaxID=83765 RepID=A0A1I5E029_9NEIS|nr:ATP-binding protein [Formivibrio citricus]SFO04812.1 hypothetical protein SAMN05660284_02798 [Formivibrio citricus]
MLKIHRIQFFNFHSFIGCAEISFAVDKKNEEAFKDFPSNAQDNVFISPIAVIGGEPQSRTNAIKCIIKLSEFISNAKHSTTDGEALLKTHPMSNSKTGTASIEFELNKKLYRYALEFDNTKICIESLHAKNNKFFSHVFARKYEHSKSATKIKINKFNVTEKQMLSMGSNLSAIAAAAQLGSKLAKELASAFSCIAKNQSLNTLYTLPTDVLAAADLYNREEPLRKQMVCFMRMTDPELLDIRIDKYPHGKPNDSKTTHMPHCVRKSPESSIAQKIDFMWQEDREIMAVFALMSKVLLALQNGEFIIIDGIDFASNKKIIPSIAKLFIDKETNPSGAQLLLATNSLDAIKYTPIGNMHISERVTAQPFHQSNFV